jgi:hypothetical protein
MNRKIKERTFIRRVSKVFEMNFLQRKRKLTNLSLLFNVIFEKEVER